MSKIFYVWDRALCLIFGHKTEEFLGYDMCSRCGHMEIQQ